MTLETHGNLFVFLCICLLVAKADEDCALSSDGLIHGCNCLNSSSLVCYGGGGNKTLPSKSLIPSDVKTLIITDYKISTLNTSSMFGILKDLVSLDLSNNQIESITEDSFSGQAFPKLQKLSLERNVINNIMRASGDTHIFMDLRSLQELNLRRAFTLDFVRNTTFKDIFNKSDFRNLKKLSLSGNDIELLDFEILHSANKLEILDLSDSNLSDVLNGTFTRASFPHLQWLDLSNNNLSVVNKAIVEDFKTLDSNDTKINLTGNPLSCSCYSIEFIKWLKNTGLIIEKERLKCEEFSGKPLVKVNESQITCSDINFPESDGFNLQYVILCIIFGILGLLALIILFMRRNDILHFCMQVRQATKDAFDSHQTHYTYSGIQNAKRVTPDTSVEASV